MKVNSSLEIHGRLKVHYKKHRDQSIAQVETCVVGPVRGVGIYK